MWMEYGCRCLDCSKTTEGEDTHIFGAQPTRQVMTSRWCFHPPLFLLFGFLVLYYNGLGGRLWIRRGGVGWPD